MKPPARSVGALRPFYDAESSNELARADHWSVLLPADAGAARLAAAQDRAVTTEQLANVGLSRNAITHRVKHRQLRRLWDGVYLLGPDAPSRRTLARAALLTCGDE